MFLEFWILWLMSGILGILLCCKLFWEGLCGWLLRLLCIFVSWFKVNVLIVSKFFCLWLNMNWIVFCNLFFYLEFKLLVLWDKYWFFNLEFFIWCLEKFFEVWWRFMFVFWCSDDLNYLFFFDWYWLVVLGLWVCFVVLEDRN